MTTIMSNVTATVTASTPIANTTCVPLKKTFVLSQFVIVLIGLPVLLFLLAAIVVFRSKLQSRVVNIYAGNVILGCTFACILRLVDATLTYFGHGPQEYTEPSRHSDSALKAWLILKIFMLTMFIGGIALVVNGLRNNVFRINRTVAGMSFKSDQQRKGKTPNRLSVWCHQNPHTEAMICVLASWLVPLLCSLVIGFTIGNCIPSCHCHFNYVPKDLLKTVCGNDCSYVWPPHSNKSIIIGAVLWILSVILMAALFIRCKIDFERVSRDITTPAPLETANEKAEEDLMDQSGDDVFEPEERPQSPVSPSTRVPTSSKVFTLKRLFFNQSSQASSSLLLIHLKKNLLVLFAISVIYVIGSGMTVLLALLSVTSQDGNFLFEGSEANVVPFYIFETIAEIIVPICLCLTLPALRSAVYSMLEVVIYCVTCGCFRKG